MLRDVGDLAFGSDTSPVHPGFEKLERQLGPVIQVAGSGYPKPLQDILNALRPCYCLRATVGESESEETLVIDATAPCEVVEAVPVDYAVGAEVVPEFAEEIWQEDFDGSAPPGDVPQARRTYHTDAGPSGDVYVFPMGLEDDQGVPLLAGMQRGKTHHLELFTTNFTGVFTGGVIDVIFVAPSNRPYFAVYCLGADCRDLAHHLRAELDLPVVHRGAEIDRTAIYDIRYNPRYVRRETDADKDVLLPIADRDGLIDIETGSVEGAYFQQQPQPGEVVVSVTEEGTETEVARLRAPSARVGPLPAYEGITARGASSDEEQSPTGTDTTPAETTPAATLSDTALSRLRDLVELQPTSNGELADRWGLSESREAYEYISTELDTFYYRDEDSMIRATEEAERIINSR
jgi:hypothetical protein